MRLALVIDRFDPARGGAERYLAGLGQRLVARGHEVRVYCNAAAGAAEAVAIVPIAVRGRSRVARERNFAADACARARADGCAPLLGIRHAPEVDVWQPHGGCWDASARARLDAEPRAWRRALRARLHRFSPRHRHFRAVERTLLARAGVVVLAVSALVRADLEASVPRVAAQLAVVPPAIDVERLRALRARAPRPAGAAPLLLFAAHDFELKGLRHALAALARSEAGRNGARLVVAGGGRAARYERLAAKTGLGAQVEFLGRAADLAPWWRQADLLLHPTWFDPCALVCLEALAAGVPVVTTARNGARDAVREAGGRVVGLPTDHAELAAAIDALLAAGAPAREAAARVGDRFDWESHLAQLLPWLEGAARRGRS